MKLVDTHCHIHDSEGGEDHTRQLWEKLGLNGEQLIARANQAEVEQMICVGTDLEDSRLAVQFAAAYDNCYASIGIHPHEAKRYVKDGTTFKQLLKLGRSAKVVAVGECGLDYFYSHSSPEDQATLLKLQLEAAIALKLPLIFHVRQAFSDFWPIFDAYPNIKGVLHSFTDSIATLEQALSRGLFIGVNGIATFAKSPDQLAMYKRIPLSRLLLETDSPYLTPTPYRGTVNEPKHVARVAEYLSALRSEPVTKLAAASTKNARLLFAI